jgi:hypothetical protein
VFNAILEAFQWFQIALSDVISWIGNQLIPWLRSVIANSNIFKSFLDIAEAIYNFFSPLIDLIWGFIELIATPVVAFVNLVTGFVSTWNNTEPIPLLFLPNCAVAPETQIICIIYWSMEVTIFSGLGAAIIPILTGTLTIIAILSFAQRFKRLFERVGNNV